MKEFHFISDEELFPLLGKEVTDPELLGENSLKNKCNDSIANFFPQYFDAVKYSTGLAAESLDEFVEKIRAGIKRSGSTLTRVIAATCDQYLENHSGCFDDFPDTHYFSFHRGRAIDVGGKEETISVPLDFNYFESLPKNEEVPFLYDMNLYYHSYEINSNKDTSSPFKPMTRLRIFIICLLLFISSGYLLSKNELFDFLPWNKTLASALFSTKTGYIITLIVGVILMLLFFVSLGKISFRVFLFGGAVVAFGFVISLIRTWADPYVNYNLLLKASPFNDPAAPIPDYIHYIVAAIPVIAAIVVLVMLFVAKSDYKKEVETYNRRIKEKQKSLDKAYYVIEDNLEKFYRLYRFHYLWAEKELDGKVPNQIVQWKNEVTKYESIYKKLAPEVGKTPEYIKL